jgi:hypothetical protein
MENTKSNEGFVRSQTNQGAIINVDEENYNAYKKQRNHVLQIHGGMGKINTLENELNNIKEDMSEIKQLLLKVLNK